MDELTKIINWYSSNCDGNWESENQIKILTSSNPGWIVEVDLKNTGMEKIDLNYCLVEVSENDWYGYSVKNGVFKGVGDIGKLNLILNKFIEIII